MKNLKDVWDVKLLEWQKRHYGQKLKKANFVSLFSKVWADLQPDCIISGFREGGIYPFNRDLIPENSYDPAALRRWKMKQQVDLQNSASSSLQRAGPSTISEQENSVYPPTIKSLIPLASALPLAPAVKTFQELLLETVKNQGELEAPRKRRRVTKEDDNYSLRDTDDEDADEYMERMVREAEEEYQEAEIEEKLPDETEQIEEETTRQNSKIN
ncbi:hypothetical protein GE061_000213 [Apolygus lucorum]|uniref:DDE-1 domain-containing protein n=1 Tax=Apolygus lucorum TaxID=248454 RepID=A0A8S9Y5P3_APOLU|nr:hypothetical protein GE061_000213 [Apolygus lucorum]